MIKVCFTGHRPSKLPWKYNESSFSCLRFKKKLKQAIEEVSQGTTTFITGMAMGVDMIAGEIVAKYKSNYDNIILEAVVPCKTQSSMWSYDYKQRYNKLLEKCDNVTYISEEYTNDCMLKRNKYMVDECDIVIAVWDGLPRSGTASTVNYALSKGKKVIFIDIDKY